MRRLSLASATARRALSTRPSFVTMGEAMLRLAPIDSAAITTESRHFPQPFLRSVGGDELNVSVALSLLGVPAKWVSVLPNGPMGDVITDSCDHHAVEFAGTRVDGDIGFFTVLPEKKMVHYQRRNGVFATHDPASLDWPSLLSSANDQWLHLTGITPMVSEAAHASWQNALTTAASSSMPISLDLNHRKQLGPLEQLWGYVRPHTPSLDLLILSVDQVRELPSFLPTCLPSFLPSPRDHPHTLSHTPLCHHARALTAQRPRQNRDRH